MREGPESNWRFVRDLALNPPRNAEQGIAALFALGATRERTLVDKTLEFMLHTARPQEAIQCAKGLEENSQARKKLAEYAKQSMALIEERYGSTFDMIGWISVRGRLAAAYSRF